MKQKIFRWLVQLLYKIFNVIERNDIVFYKPDKRIFRVLDMSSDNSIYLIDDSSPTPMRMGPFHRHYLKLRKKFFRDSGIAFRPKDNGWRIVGRGFRNIFTKETLIENHS